MAAFAAFADPAVYRVEADVAERFGRLHPIDGRLCSRRSWNISAGAFGAVPRGKSEWRDAGVGLGSGHHLLRESESDLHAGDSDGRVPVSGILHLGRGVLRRVRTRRGESVSIFDQMRVLSGRGMPYAVRRMVSSGVNGGWRGGSQLPRFQTQRGSTQVRGVAHLAFEICSDRGG